MISFKKIKRDKPFKNGLGYIRRYYLRVYVVGLYFDIRISQKIIGIV